MGKIKQIKKRPTPDYVIDGEKFGIYECEKCGKTEKMKYNDLPLRCPDCGNSLNFRMKSKVE